jgi:hypothetical protein
LIFVPAGYVVFAPERRGQVVRKGNTSLMWSGRRR